MKKRYLLIPALLLSVIGITSLTLNAATTESATSTSWEGTYSLEEMLNYAIQDEYKAQATYAAIIETYGEIRPFTRIILAEETHIAELELLFEAYGYTVPENTASLDVVVPASVEEALAAGVQAEIDNIAMYESFLAQVDLPQDVTDTFTNLMNASQSHLNAFTRNQLVESCSQAMNQFGKGLKDKANQFGQGFRNQMNKLGESLSGLGNQFGFHKGK